jgi:hypothetical protein
MRNGLSLNKNRSDHRVRVGLSSELVAILPNCGVASWQGLIRQGLTWPVADAHQDAAGYPE